MYTDEQNHLFFLIRQEGIIGSEAQFLAWFPVDAVIASNGALVASSMSGNLEAQYNVKVLLGIVIGV